MFVWQSHEVCFFLNAWTEVSQTHRQPKTDRNLPTEQSHNWLIVLFIKCQKMSITVLKPRGLSLSNQQSSSPSYKTDKSSKSFNLRCWSQKYLAYLLEYWLKQENGQTNMGRKFIYSPFLLSLSFCLSFPHTNTHTRCKLDVQTIQFHSHLLFLWLIQGDQSDLLQTQKNQFEGWNPEANWCFPYHASTQHVATNCPRLSFKYKHLLVSDQRAVEREDDKQLAHICVCLSECQSVFMSVCLSRILHLSTYLPTASSVSVNWQIPAFIVQKHLSWPLFLPLVLSHMRAHTHTHSLNEKQKWMNK